MKGLSSPQSSGAWRFVWCCVVGGLVLAACLLVFRSGLPYPVRRLVSDLGLLAGGIALALSCGQRTLLSRGRRRRAWGFCCAAGVSAALGNLWVLIVHLSANPNRQTPSTYFFVLALLCGIAAMMTFPSAPRRGTDLARLVSDGVIIGAALFLIAGVAVFPQLDRPEGGFQLTLALPIVDLATATFAALLVLRVGRADRPALAFLSAGCVLYAASDLAYAVLSARGSFQFGGPWDAGWIAGYVLIAVAAQHPATTRQSTEERRETSSAVGSALIFVLLLMAAVVTIRHSRLGSFDRLATGLWLTVLVAVALRQILLILDNDRLRHGLEQRVSERTRELRDLTRRSELLLSSVGEGIYGVDVTGLITFVNPAGARTLGCRPEDLIGTSAHATFHATQPDGTPYPIEQCYITEAIRDRAVTTTEEDRYRQADGRDIPVEVTATPLAADGGVQGAVVVFRDITQRLEVDRLKDEFVSMVSHELRTPLTAIRGALGLLAGGALGTLPTPAARMAELAVGSSDRLTRLINDILDLERVQAGSLSFDLRDHDAAELIAAAIAQVQLLAADAGVMLRATDTPIRVHADADRVVQTLVNLLGNAIKFSSRGAAIDVGAQPSSGQVEFFVEDQGRGIPPERLGRIFNRFEQVDSSDARDRGGTGLGLAISRSLVERMDGRIWAESVAGQGSTFRFTLPAAKPVAPDDARDDQPFAADGVPPAPAEGADRLSSGSRPSASRRGVEPERAGAAR